MREQVMPDTCSEPVPISDVYADGIAYVENLGNCIRVAYFVWQRVAGRRGALLRPRDG